MGYQRVVSSHILCSSMRSSFRPRYSRAILSLTMNSSIWLFSTNRDSVSRMRYLVNSCVVKARPLAAKLQMARLNTLSVNSYSMSV